MGGKLSNLRFKQFVPKRKVCGNLWIEDIFGQAKRWDAKIIIIFVVSATGCWEELPTAGGPGGLQDHTIVTHKSNLLVLGGQLAGREDEGGLWLFSTDTLTWSRPRVGHGPPSLRGHTASVWGSSMYVWGGLRQVLGASQALWRLDLDQSKEPYSAFSWVKEEQVGEVPSPRHQHAAAVQQDFLYVHGGEHCLSPSNLFHRLHLPSLTWEQLPHSSSSSLKSSPPPMQGHSLLVSPSGSLLLIPSRSPPENTSSSTSSHSLPWWTFVLSTGAWRRLLVGKNWPSGIPVLLGQPSSSLHRKGITKKLSSERLKKDTEPSIRAGWGEENGGFQDEVPPPLPDLLIDLQGSGCSYNVGDDRVTLLQKSEKGEEGKEEQVVVKKRVMVKEEEVLELLMLGKEEETTFTWAKTNLNIWRANISVAF